MTDFEKPISAVATTVMLSSVNGADNSTNSITADPCDRRKFNDRLEGHNFVERLLEYGLQRRAGD